jgi:hypothetical protein
MRCQKTRRKSFGRKRRTSTLSTPIWKYSNMCCCTWSTTRLGRVPATIATNDERSSTSLASIAGDLGTTQISTAGRRWRAPWTLGEGGHSVGGTGGDRRGEGLPDKPDSGNGGQGCPPTGRSSERGVEPASKSGKVKLSVDWWDDTRPRTICSWWVRMMACVGGGNGGEVPSGTPRTAVRCHTTRPPATGEAGERGRLQILARWPSYLHLRQREGFRHAAASWSASR